MDFPSSSLTPATAYTLLVSTVVPRPIAFVTTVNSDGRVNAAPFSFFNAMGSEPPVVVIGFEPKADGSQKDTPNNIVATGEFVVNLVNEAMAVQMNQCAASLTPDVDEAALANLVVTPSSAVSPPRLEASPVSFECRKIDQTLLTGGGRIIVGEILHAHVDDDLIDSMEPLRINIDKLGVISRLSGPLYGRITDQFSLKRPGAS